jgi:hypothetical protein
VPIHPPVVAATYVLAIYLDYLLHPVVVMRSLAVAIMGATLLALAAGAVMRDLRIGSIIATGGLFALASKPLTLAVGKLYESRPIIAAIFVLASLLFVVVAVRILWRQATAPGLTRWLNTTSLVLFLIVVGSAIPAGFPAVLAPDFARTDPSLPRGGDPDIAVLLLDAYPAESTLERVYSYDNTDFTDALAARGFDVVNDSRANYWFTSLSLASLFHMRLVDDVPELAAIARGDVPPNPYWRQALNHAPAFGFLHERGYHITTVSSGAADISLQSADEYVDPGQLTDFEALVLRKSFVADLVDAAAPTFFVEQQRDRIASVFVAFVAAATDGNSDRPNFTFAHVPAPHPPLAVTADGERASWSGPDSFYGITVPQMGISTGEYIDRFLAQLAYVNNRTLEAVDAVRDANPNAVIVVMSDHGPGNPADVNPEAEADIASRLYNLMAVRHPDRRLVIPDGSSPVNLLARIFDAYLDGDFALSPDSSYTSTFFGTDDMYLELQPVPSGALSGR